MIADHRSLPGLLLAALVTASSAAAQLAPTPQEYATYTGVHKAAANGNASEIDQLAQEGANVNTRDSFGRTPLIVAVFRRDDAVARALIDAGANLNALDNQSYDALTIAAVLDDLDMVKLLIQAGANTRAITSPFGGTALIAAAHLGHAEVVAALIAARAPIDHVNYLGATALIEAIALGDGGERQQATVDALIKGGANLNLADADGKSPLALAREKNATRIAQMLEQAGAKP